MRRISFALAFLLALSSPAIACQYGSTGERVVSIGALNSQTLSVTSTAVGLTLPTTYASGGATVNQVLEATVFVTSGVVNVFSDGTTPTASTTVGGAPFGSGAAGGTALNLCGARAISLARFISQSGTATLVILYGGF